MSNNNQGEEYELTYLVNKVPDEVSTLSPKEMLDIYVPDTSGVHSQLRIRKKDNQYEITKKQPISEGDASSHTEATISINEDEFTALKKCSSKVVSKLRYDIVVDGHPAELDVFQGELLGLIVIDFEFESKEVMQSFKPPSLCLADITQEDFIAGGIIAGKSYKDVEPELNRFDYTPIYL